HGLPAFGIPDAPLRSPNTRPGPDFGGSGRAATGLGPVETPYRSAPTVPRPPGGRRRGLGRPFAVVVWQNQPRCRNGLAAEGIRSAGSSGVGDIAYRSIRIARPAKGALEKTGTSGAAIPENLTTPRCDLIEFLPASSCSCHLNIGGGSAMRRLV